MLALIFLLACPRLTKGDADRSSDDSATEESGDPNQDDTGLDDSSADDSSADDSSADDSSADDSSADDSSADDSDSPAPVEDADGDGWTLAEGDCDDEDSAVLPARWEDDNGAITDLSASFAAGSPSAPAVITLSESGTLTVCDGTWYVSLSLSGAATTLEGVNGAALTTLSAAGLSPVVSLSPSSGSLEVRGLTLTEGLGSTGGAIENTGKIAAISVKDSILSYNKASTGGALYVNTSSLTLVNSTLDHNESLGGGGGIAAEQYAAVTISGSTLSNNSASSGGALYLNYNGAQVNSSVIRDNTASSYGGGVYEYYTTATFTDTEISGNLAAYGGGIAVGNWGAVSMVCTSTDSGGAWSNVATTYGGGAIGFYEGTVRSSDCYWGGSSDDNSPGDVAVGWNTASLYEYTGYESGESFTCSGVAYCY